jgi:type IV secretion system protein TrbL
MSLFCLLVIGVWLNPDLASEALAQSSCTIAGDNNALDCVLISFQEATRNWEAELARLALRLFWILALIEFTFSAIQLAFRGADFSEWMASLLNQILFIGFFAALLQFSSQWAGAIIASFREAANIAGGVSVIRPSDIFDVGVKLGAALISDLSILNLAFSIILIIAAFFLLIAFGLIAASLIVALVESYIVISAGVLMMGFGGSRWTKDYAVRTFQYSLSVGAKLFIIQLLAGLILVITAPWTSELASYWTRSWTSLFVLLGVSVVFVCLVRTIPDMVQGLINGTSLASGGGLYGTASGIAAGAVTGSVAGGMALRSAGLLASEQLRSAQTAGTGPDSSSGRAAFLARRTAGNLASAGTANIGDRLSGRVPAQGKPLAQMASKMSDAEKKLKAEREETTPDSSKNTHDES